MRAATVQCGGTIHVLRSVAVQCGAVVTVSTNIDSGYTVPMNGIDIGLGVNAPSDDWAILLASSDVGSVSIDGQLLLYTPPADYTGPAVVSYTLINGAASIPAVINLDVVDENPVLAVSDTLYVLENSPGTVLAVKANDIGRFQIITASVDVGSIVIVPAGILYTPPANYVGPYNITYELEAV